MKLGTIVELPDGRRGTVVYHGLDGYGIIWGEHAGITTEEALAFSLPSSVPRDKRPAVAMLREPYAGSDPDMAYVGSEFTKIREPGDAPDLGPIVVRIPCGPGTFIVDVDQFRLDGARARRERLGCVVCGDDERVEIRILEQATGKVLNSFNYQGPEYTEKPT